MSAVDFEKGVTLASTSDDLKALPAMGMLLQGSSGFSYNQLVEIVEKFRPGVLNFQRGLSASIRIARVSVADFLTIKTVEGYLNAIFIVNMANRILFQECTGRDCPTSVALGMTGISMFWDPDLLVNGTDLKDVVNKILTLTHADLKVRVATLPPAVTEAMWNGTQTTYGIACMEATFHRDNESVESGLLNGILHAIFAVRRTTISTGIMRLIKASKTTAVFQQNDDLTAAAKPLGQIKPADAAHLCAALESRIATDDSWMALRIITERMRHQGMAQATIVYETVKLYPTYPWHTVEAMYPNQLHKALQAYGAYRAVDFAYLDSALTKTHGASQYKQVFILCAKIRLAVDPSDTILSHATVLPHKDDLKHFGALQIVTDDFILKRQQAAASSTGPWAGATKTLFDDLVQKYP